MEGKIIKCVPNDPIERSPEDILDAEIFENEGEIEIANQGNENQEGGIVIDAGDDEEIENENPTELKATKGAKSKKKVPTKPIKKTDSKKTNQQTTKVSAVKKPPTPKVFVGNAFQKESLEQHNLLIDSENSFPITVASPFSFSISVSSKKRAASLTIERYSSMNAQSLV